MKKDGTLLKADKMVTESDTYGCVSAYLSKRQVVPFTDIGYLSTV